MIIIRMNLPKIGFDPGTFSEKWRADLELKIQNSRPQSWKPVPSDTILQEKFVLKFVARQRYQILPYASENSKYSSKTNSISIRGCPSLKLGCHTDIRLSENPKEVLPSSHWIHFLSNLFIDTTFICPFLPNDLQL